MKKEEWKDIPEYEGLYQISNLGNVKSINFNHTGKVKIMKLGIRNAGYYYVNLCKNNIAKKHNIHRLVALAFIPNPEDKKEVNHINGIKKDNILSNLEWTTKMENETHAKINYLKASGERHGMSKLTKIQVQDIREINRAGLFTRKEIAKEYGIETNTVSDIINKKIWKYV